MYAAERQQWLLDRTRDEGRVDVAVTAEELDVTPETIRRDLGVLERQGLLRRVHGGAIPSDLLGFEPGVGQRDAVAVPRRNASPRPRSPSWTARRRVLLDAGTTTARLAEMLPRDRDLTVVTNSLPIATLLAARPNMTVLADRRAGPRPHHGHRRRLGHRAARPRSPSTSRSSAPTASPPSAACPPRTRTRARRSRP